MSEPEINAPAASGEAGAQPEFKRNRTEGFVIECDGERATIAAMGGKNAAGSDDYWAVGQMISVRVNENRLVGLIYKVDAPEREWNNEELNVVHIHIELIGQVTTGEGGKTSFSTGISSYPYMGAIAHRIRSADLQTIYAASSADAVPIGQLTQDKTIPALIDIDKLLARHFAVVGTTGVGKSTSVTLLLRKIVEKRPDVRILVLDPHNEFATAFAEKAITVDANRLDLPFWIFKLDEFCEVIFRGRPTNANEVDALRDLIPIAKERYRRTESGQATSALIRRDREVTSLTADTPTPYRMADLLAIIDERIGQLDGKQDRPHLKTLRNRLDSLINDPRFRFMFGSKTVSDSMAATLAHVFRLPQNGKPICVFEMSNLPSEVVNSVVSVLCRMAFDVAMSSDGGVQTLVVCEEAHRYIPSDQNAGFWPTRQAIARIAKEGRKYGVYLGVITQRPGELDQTILSQCNTIFAMRLGNEADQLIVKKAISGGARSTTNFLSSIANRECIAFGEAFHTPMRMVFETIRKEDLPGAHIYEQQAKVKAGLAGMSMENIIRRMRNQEMEEEIEDDEDDFVAEGSADAEAALLAEVQTSMDAPAAPRGTAGEVRAPVSAPPVAPTRLPGAAAASPAAPRASVSAAAGPATAGRDAPAEGGAPSSPQFWYAEDVGRPLAPTRPRPGFGQSAQPSSDQPAGSEPRSRDLIRSFRNRT